MVVKGGGRRSKQQRPGMEEPLVGKEERRRSTIKELELVHQHLDDGVLVRCQALSVVGWWMWSRGFVGSRRREWKEGTSGLNHCRSLFLVGFYHPVRCHPPDYGRQWFDGASGMWSASTSLSLWEREDRLSSLQNLTQVGITDVLRWVGECEEGWSKDLCQDTWLQSSVCWCAGSW